MGIERKSASTSVPIILQQQLCCNRSCSKLSGDSVAHQAHILNYVFLCGLVPNLINCENVVGGMSQLSVAPNSIPVEGLSVLSPSTFPSALPNHEVPYSLTHFTKILFAGLVVSHEPIVAWFSHRLCLWIWQQNGQ